MILLRDFADERQVNSHTVATYIRRNEALFKGHLGKDGNKLTLDEYAVELLSKVYRPPAPEKDWRGLEDERDYYMNEYLSAMRRIENLRERIDNLRDFELKYKALETSYEHQLLMESSKQERAKDKAVAEAVAKVEEEKAAEIAELKDSHKKEIESMSFRDWWNRKK